MLWLPLKGKNIQRQIVLHYTYNFHTQKYGVFVTAVSMTKIGDFIVDFLLEFEAIFKKGLTRVSGA
jgi:hypothetical protein